jgi:hypothetical protein
VADDELGIRATATGAGKPALREHPAALVPWRCVTAETPHFQAYRGTESPRFVNEAELEYAKILDYYGVPWLYEPRTFVLEEDADGRVLEAFTPDFYLPEQDLYLEVTVMKQSLVTRKNRKLRKLKERYPEIKIKLFYERDFERLASRYGLRKAS